MVDAVNLSPIRLRHVSLLRDFSLVICCEKQSWGIPSPSSDWNEQWQQRTQMPKLKNVRFF